MDAKLKVAVLGATGYSGMELTRILLRHPRVQTPVLLRRREVSDEVFKGIAHVESNVAHVSSAWNIGQLVF